MRMLPLLLAAPALGGLVAPLLGEPPAPGASTALTVRATAVVAPCLRAAAASFQAEGHGEARVELGPLGAPEADILAGVAVELTRALEGGVAAPGSDVALARIPWVLAVPRDHPGELRSLEDVAAAGVEIRVPRGAAAIEARRILARLKDARVVETADAGGLPASAVAVVPLSLSAGAAHRLTLDVPPLELQAAFGARARRPEAAAEFVRYLETERGSAALAACGLAADEGAAAVRP
jgi:hypothetical protein